MFLQKPKSPLTIPPELLSPVTLGGLHGRMARLPAKKSGQKKIVFIHGQHAALERFYTTLEFLNDYGEVIMPDLPGHGGMTSFYKVGKKPTYDAYADYLYTFLKANDLTKDIVLIGNSRGLQNLTRMFQKYPESQKWTSQVIGLAGFGAGSDFHIPMRFKIIFYAICYASVSWLGSKLITILFFNRLSLRVMISVFKRFKAKMQNDDSNLRKDMARMEEYLWYVNDHRTHAYTVLAMFKGDLRRYTNTKIKLKLHNIVTEHDQYFDHKRVAKTCRDLYESYEESPLDLKVHTPSMIATKEDVAAVIPEQTKKLLLS